MGRTREIEKLYNKANFQNLIYHFNGPTKEINFHDCNDAERNLLIQIARGHKFNKDYFKMAHKAADDLKRGKGIKMLSPKKYFKDYKLLLHK